MKKCLIFILIGIIFILSLVLNTKTNQESFTNNNYSLNNVRSFKNKTKRKILKKVKYYSDEILYRLKKIKRFVGI